MSKILRILLIEDDPYFRADIARKLKAYGMVVQTGELAQALSALREAPFDVALIDLNLQGENGGPELIRAARAAGVTPIVLTGNDDPLMVARAYELGCKH
jgi:DNA-binding NarL/FixJ family response regulator